VSDSSNPRDQIVWRLRVAAEVPGIDYDAAFDVPVFRTAESDLPETENPGPAARVKPAEYQQPADSRIAVSTSRRGTEIFFAAGRNLGVATGWTAFTVLWTAVVTVLFLSDVPILFPIVFGLFELLLVLGALDQWLGVSRVTADRGTLSIERGYVVPGRAHVIEGGRIADITTKIGMQAGSRPYYDIVIVRKDGKRMTAGRGLRNKREAEWLVERLKIAVGLTAPERSLEADIQRV
jgi:hypothetical protein